MSDDTETDILSEEEKQFWNVVDTFIDTANSATEIGDPGIVGSAMLYAAARYSAFNIALVSESRKDFLADSEDSIHHLSTEFKKLLEENMEDYGENYKVLLREEE